GTVAGANGTPAADAAQGATQVQGGGAAPAANMESIVAALKGVIEALTALIAALQAQVAATTGGGPGGTTDPTQLPAGKATPPPPGKDIPLPPSAPPPGSVGDANGPGQAPPKGGPTQTPPSKGDDANGPGQAPPKVVQTPP